MITCAPLCFAPNASALPAPPAPTSTKVLPARGELLPEFILPISPASQIEIWK